MSPRGKRISPERFGDCITCALRADDGATRKQPRCVARHWTLGGVLVLFAAFGLRTPARGRKARFHHRYRKLRNFLFAGSAREANTANRM